jgi:hypothetical protein
MASPLLRLVEKLTKQQAKRAARLKDADKELKESGAVAETYRPTSDQPVAQSAADEDATSFFGPSSSELDRASIVDDTLQQIKQDNPKVKFSGSIEEQLDDVERGLIDEGVIGDLTRKQEDFVRDPQGAREQSLRMNKKPTDFKKRRTYPGDNRPPEGSEASRVIELQEIKEAMESGKGKRVAPGTAAGLENPKTASRADDVDVIGEKRDARVKEIDEQLKSLRDPEMRESPAIKEALAEDIVEADVADLAAGQAFGRSTSKRKFDPSKTTADREIDNFGLRQLEDIYGINQTGTPAERAVTGFRKELGDAARASGRLPEPGARVAVPPDVKAFMNRRRPDASRLDEAQEKLTGPLKEPTRLRLLLEQLKKINRTADLKTKRVKEEKRKELAQSPLRKMFRKLAKDREMKERQKDTD